MTIPLLFANFNFRDMEWVMNMQSELLFEFAGERDIGKFLFHGKYKDVNRGFINQVN